MIVAASRCFAGGNEISPGEDVVPREIHISAGGVMALNPLNENVNQQADVDLSNLERVEFSAVDALKMPETETATKKPARKMEQLVRVLTPNSLLKKEFPLKAKTGQLKNTLASSPLRRWQKISHAASGVIGFAWHGDAAHQKADQNELFDGQAPAAERGRVPGGFLKSTGDLDSFRSAKTLRKNNKENIALVKYSAGNMAQDLIALSGEIKLSQKLKVSAPVLEERGAVILKNVLQNLRPGGKGEISSLGATFLTAATRAVERLGQSGGKPKDVSVAVEKLAGGVLGVAHYDSNSPVDFAKKSEKHLDHIDFRPPSLISKIFNVSKIAAFTLLSLRSIAHAAFLPLPSQINFNALLSAHGLGFLGLLAAALPWAFMRMGVEYLSPLTGEKYVKYFDPIWTIPKAQLYFLLPLFAWGEEITFRLGLFTGMVYALSFLSMPLLPAMIAGAVVSSVIFARAHGYGQTLPRFLSGVLLCYLMLTHGLFFATAVHTLSNLMILILKPLSSAIQKYTAKTPKLSS